MISEIKLHKVSKRFGTTRVLASVSASFVPGQCTALLGANGAGKSTLVGILSTLITPSSGELQFSDTEQKKVSGTELRAALGVLAHESFLYASLTAVENLNLYADLYGVSRQEVFSVLQRVELSRDAWLSPVRNYSRGMTQRLALARAMLHDPSVILLDEPFSGLDRNGCQRLQSMLLDWRDQKKIVIVVSHELEWLAGVVNQVLVLDRGQLALSQTRQAPFDLAELTDFVGGNVKKDIA